MDTMGSDHDSVLQEEDILWEDINHLQFKSQLNRDLLTSSQLVHFMNHPSQEDVPVISWNTIMDQDIGIVTLGIGILEQIQIS